MLISLSAGCGIPSSLSFLLSSVFLLNVAVFADLAWYLAVGGLCLGLVELSYPLTQSRASSTTGTVSSAAYIRAVWSFSRSLTTSSLKLAGPKSASLNLASALLSARRHLCFSRHLWSRSSFLRGLTSKSFQDVFISSGTFSLVELEKPISDCFLTEITSSLCN